MSSERSTSPDSVAEQIQTASDVFDKWCADRHEEGAEKYGPLKFITANTLEEAMFEIVDLANYARYTFIKLWLMNQKLGNEVSAQIGAGAFTPTKEG